MQSQWKTQLQGLKRKEKNINVPYGKKAKILSDSSKTCAENIKKNIENGFKKIIDGQSFNKFDKNTINLNKSYNGDDNNILTSLNMFSDNSEDIHTLFRSKIEYQVECLQLDIDKNFLQYDDIYDKKLISENYYPCLEKLEHYYCFVEPIDAECKDIDYDPLLDGSIQNLNTFTDIELSFLREVSCGCESLSWDQYEKLNIVSPDNNTKNLSNFHYRTNSLIHKNFSKKSKYIIEDSSLYYHGPNNISPIYISEGVDETTSDIHSPLNGELLNEQAEDPLSVASISLDIDQVSSADEFLPVSASEFEYLRNRMEEFKIKNTGQDNLQDYFLTSRRKSVDGNNPSSRKEVNPHVIDTILDNFEEITKIINLPQNMLPEEKEKEIINLYKAISSKEKEENFNSDEDIIEPSTSNSRSRQRKRKENLPIFHKELFNESIAKTVQGRIISNKEYIMLKQADLILALTKDNLENNK